MRNTPYLEQDNDLEGLMHGGGIKELGEMHLCLMKGVTVTLPTRKEEMH